MAGGLIKHGRGATGKRRRHATHEATSEPSQIGTDTMLKILGWAILIIFIIGLLVVTGILKLIF